MAAKRKYPAELRERAVRLYRESTPKPVIAQLTRQLNVHPEALRNWIRQDQAVASGTIVQRRRCWKLMSAQHAYATAVLAGLSGGLVLSQV
ncbi:hypothetical protein A4G26_22720 [Mycobacterium kansasii]|uniref:Transposase n=1 Tax=Mycobacterium innocens TaxID=2341083 RepID=A0A498QJ53_9MYCO|nr:MULTISPECIES: transposase [Mycobacterium]KZS75090.1 hypothetical protein A4G26_22720 [Mycobacterium kansasii]VBA45448.1 hypothetical protein LAUMK13_05467 [Mycobacterium innocens]